MLKITLTKGLVGKRVIHRKVVTALGLGKYGSSVERADTPTIRGMVNKVSHLVTVTEVGEEEGTEKQAERTAARSRGERSVDTHGVSDAGASGVLTK
jgi:large subunit ribosomal protein L30